MYRKVGKLATRDAQRWVILLKAIYRTSRTSNPHSDVHHKKIAFCIAQGKINIIKWEWKECRVMVTFSPFEKCFHAHFPQISPRAFVSSKKKFIKNSSSFWSNLKLKQTRALPMLHNYFATNLYARLIFMLRWTLRSKVRKFSFGLRLSKYDENETSSCFTELAPTLWYNVWGKQTSTKWHKVGGFSWDGKYFAFARLGFVYGWKSFVIQEEEEVGGDV